MKKITFLMALLCASVMSFSAEVVVKTLDTTGDLQGTNNAYASDCDIESDGFIWNFTGNSKINPWRLGGKDLTNADKTLYTKTVIEEDITSITIEHGNITLTAVNSLKLQVANSADFSDAVSYDGTVTKNTTTTFTRPESTSWANKYYKFVYNVTAAAGGSNSYVEIKTVVFYAAAPDVHATDIQLSENAISMKQYKSATIVATLTPAEATDVIEWTSDKPEVATVENGVVYAAGEGEAVITAKVSETVSATCTVTVTAPEVLTCKEAAEKALSVSANNVLYENGMYVVYGYVTALVSGGYNDTYGDASFWIADEANGGNVFEIYAVAPMQDADKAVKVGDYIMAVGNLTKYNTTPEMSGKNDAKAFYTITTDTPTNLENVNAMLDMNAPMYNVMGQQVSADYKGIVIQNGSKFMLQ